MGSEDVLVEIHPRELRFLVEVKKQSSCCIHLVNKMDQYVAFKVKTTSPKRYCVRPNVGVILPLASRDFTVTMQAPKNDPPDLQTKDKFLVQTTVVPFGTADEDIVPAFFSKETDQYIEEKKLKVVAVSITEPQVEQLLNGVLKETAAVPVAEQTPDNDFLVPPKQASLPESTSNLKKTSVASIETQFSSTEASVDLKESPPREYTPAPSEVPSLSDKESKNADNVHIHHVAKDVQNLQMKLNNLEIKLEEANTLIVKLRQANRTTIQERDRLQKETVFLKRAGAARSRSSTRFPLLFVIYMAVVGISLGYLLHL